MKINHIEGIIVNRFTIEITHVYNEVMHTKMLIYTCVYT